eukprot:11197139-Lingulodinium_polyedra.AAC.1
MPATQQQCDLLFNQLRFMGHILERSANNIGSALNPQHSRPSHAFTTETYHVSGYQQVPTSDEQPYSGGHFSAETRTPLPGP